MECRKHWTEEGGWMPEYMDNADSTIAEAIRLLDAHPDFKVVRRVLPRAAFAESDGRALSKGVVVDTETTGINPDKDAIIELGMVLFEFDHETGRVYLSLIHISEPTRL